MSKIDLQAIYDYFQSHPAVIAVYLFGSYAREQASPLSDVDIGVLVELPTEAAQVSELRQQFIYDLQGLLHREAVDVIVLNEAPLALQYRVLRDGKLIFCRDEQQRILYQATTVSRYLDFKPVIEQHERAILDRARRGELLNGHNAHRGTLAHYRQLRKRFTRTR